MQISVIVVLRNDHEIVRQEHVELDIPNSGSALALVPKALGVMVAGLLDEAIPEVLEGIAAEGKKEQE